MTRKLPCPMLVAGSDGRCLGCGRLTSMATGVLQHRRGMEPRPKPPTRPRSKATLSPAQLEAIAEQAEEDRVMAAWERGFERARLRLPDPRGRYAGFRP